jgi:Xylose isomerase-like TIM barrel.
MNMALEPVYWHPLEDLDTTVAVFEKMNSKHLKMIFDPANVLTSPQIAQDAYWKEWVQALGNKIDAIHMKDFKMISDNQYTPCELGEGIMNYTELIKWLKINIPDIAIIREELNPRTAQKDIQYMKDLWNNTK